MRKPSKTSSVKKILCDSDVKAKADAGLAALQMGLLTEDQVLALIECDERYSADTKAILER